MKMKERKEKNDCRVKKVLWKEGFIRPYQKTGLTDFNELQVIDSSNIEGTNSQVMGESSRKGWFVGRGHTNGTIKLAMAVT